MRTHRFYVGSDIQLKKDFWIRDEALLWQWSKVLRFSPGQEVVLFDGVKTDRMYELVSLSKNEAHLKMITELERRLPAKHIYLLWSLLKRDNNEHILQKCTEIGVSNFVPIISERTIKKDFNLDRARKIAIEASEQCGRSDVPVIREPIRLQTALDEYADKLQFLVCHQGSHKPQKYEAKTYGILVGPEGGWSDNEQKMFSKQKLQYVDLSKFTLRGETAAIVATSKLL